MKPTFLAISFLSVWLLAACSKGGTSPSTGNNNTSNNNTNNNTTTDPYIVSTFAGSGRQALTDGTGPAASFGYTLNIAADGSGNIYVFDWAYSKIRKITPAGVVTTIAVSAPVLMQESASMTADATGSLYFTNNDALLGTSITKISPSAVVTNIPESFAFYSGNDTAVDASGNIIVSVTDDKTIWKVTPAGVATVLAGSKKSGRADGTGPAASFTLPGAVTADASGNVFVLDEQASGGSSPMPVIRKITPAAVVTSIPVIPASSFIGYNISGMAVDASGNFYVADKFNYKVFKISATGAASLIAGNGQSDPIVNGAGLSSTFSTISDLTIDGSGAIYVADRGHDVIRKIVKQ